MKLWFRCNALVAFSGRLHELAISLEELSPKVQRKEFLDGLIPELYAVAVDAFGKSLPYEAIDERTRTAEYLLLLKRQGRIIGYAVNDLLEIAGQRVNYYATALLRREIQQHGLYELLNEHRADALPASIVMTRTQNPVVYRSMQRLCVSRGYELHPNGKAVPEAMRAIARAYCGADEQLIARGVYFGRSLMDDTPLPKTEEERKVWSNIAVEKGDAVVIVGVRPL
ncbi:MAG: hypothetical protein V1725_04620 [archaeon]